MFVLPSVVCSTKLSREIADAVGAITVSHQHGCGHIGPDIVQTRELFVGLAMNPNVVDTLVASLGCETIQGKHVIAELERRGYPTHLIGIQDCGGYEGALTAGIAEGHALVQRAKTVERADFGLDAMTLGITVSRPDPRIEELINVAKCVGMQVVIATDGADTGNWAADASSVVVGEIGPAPVSVVQKAGAGAQLLAAVAACGVQVIIDFPAANQPPQGFALVPVLAVAADTGLHAVISHDFDLTAGADETAILARAAEVFSGDKAKSELRGFASFAIPRLLRTM